MILKRDFFKGPNKIFELGLSPFQIAVYLYLCRCGDNAFPGLRTIEKKCGMSRPTVIKVLGELESLGLLEKTKRFDGAKSNVYRLILPIIESEETE